ncbi:MAG: 50S ribosomal protein L3 [Eubacteriales bacterium]|nr:50S ribosomal protein L3 [Eubacteriales bacterium]
MNKAILGRKLGMTQKFLEDGRLVPVTVIQAGPCTVVQKKTVESDGYESVQVSYETLPENRAKKLVNKPEAGHFKKAGVAPAKHLKEFRFEDISGYEVGQTLTVEQFAAGDKIDVTGTSRGRGFTNLIQRNNFGRGPMAHGSKYHRGVGSLSGSSSPSKVFKGRPLPSQYGNAKVTVQNLEVVEIDAERNLMLVHGAVPGPNNGLLFVRNSNKAK